ncbi:type VI secretion system TssO [Flavisolibacter ginsenosidimutans]|uniref:Type VI secretion system transmembrane protein TssO n=1 Tax=Flavisolibacter ginsenosidimutans TaxID=661481 RepID=A0A5B8UJE0_9BACT|nr:type VI secretion system TssO [Flavisolibacter ginsenosidimutans]QEC56807.1 hypothetical protein FSB75_13165 [Flavisolibacter ginsenosidimutans]
MKPLNSAERTNAFLRFLLLFLITVALIVTVIFFSIEVPRKENDQLRQKVLAMQKEKETSESFDAAVVAVSNELKEFDASKEPPAAKYYKIKVGIDKMSDLLKGFSNADNLANSFIVQSLADLNDAKLKLSNK